MSIGHASFRPGQSVVAAAITIIVAVLVAGCADDATTGSSARESAVGVAPTSNDPGAGLIGPGCAPYAAAHRQGPASFAGMATDPVATAASHNPSLRRLTAAISGRLNRDVDLSETLDGSQFTVFAPVDAAFDKLPTDMARALATDSALLTKILVYHLVAGRIAPEQIDGTHKTIEGHDLSVDGTGDDLRVNHTAALVCGGIATENATVYLVDSVLVPPS